MRALFDAVGFGFRRLALRGIGALVRWLLTEEDRDRLFVRRDAVTVSELALREQLRELGQRPTRRRSIADLPAPVELDGAAVRKLVSDGQAVQAGVLSRADRILSIGEADLNIVMK